jgi:hypothetical protein
MPYLRIDRHRVELLGQQFATKAAFALIESGVVRAIHVSDGQDVRAGDVLIELDPTMSSAELGHLKSESDGGAAGRCAVASAPRLQAFDLKRLSAPRLAFIVRVRMIMQHQQD